MKGVVGGSVKAIIKNDGIKRGREIVVCYSKLLYIMSWMIERQNIDYGIVEKSDIRYVDIYSLLIGHSFAAFIYANHYLE